MISALLAHIILMMNRYRLFFLAVMVPVFFVSGCGAPKAGNPTRTRYRQSRMTLGTVVHVDVCLDKEAINSVEDVYEKVWAGMDQVYRTMSPRLVSSDVWKVNHSYPDPVEVHAATYQVIKRALKLSRRTNGAFDITVKPLMDLWQAAQEQNRLPDETMIRKKIAAVGPMKIRLLDGQRVQLAHPESQIDLGGIAKGYAIDQAAAVLREAGWPDFYIDAGGDIYVAGHNCRGRSWRIGVRHPRKPDRIIDTLVLSDSAVTTSGDYERFFSIGQHRWSHIIYPLTGYPARDIVSATVIAPDATTADALSTALCVLAPDRGLGLIDSWNENFAALITQESPQGRIRVRPSRRYPNFK